MIHKCILPVLLCLYPLLSEAQTIYFGQDLSYVNQMEDCGAVYRENGEEKDVYQIFADHGTNLVRVRLWHTPSWQNSLVQPAGVKDQYSDFEDVRETIQRAKELGMEVLLDFHLSDAWADPGRQVIPQAWLDVAYDTETLKDSVYNYVVKVLGDLHKDNLLPELVQIGNEANPGIMIHETMNANLDPIGVISSDWNRHAELFNVAIQAVRDFSDTTSIKPLIALHAADLDKVSWWFNNIINHGVTDFDIMGISYYYAWHEASIEAMGNKINQLRFEHPGYDVMVLETGYLWSQRNYDGMPNIITTPDPDYLPVSPQKQLEYMIDFQREVINSGGIGTVFWEPAWVSTPCRTPWGQGSAHDHVVFFDPYTTNFMEDGAGHWPERRFYEDPGSPKITFIVNVGEQDVTNGVFLKGSWNDAYYPMVHLEDTRYQYAIYELNEGDTVGYYFLTDTSPTIRETIPEACALWESADRILIVGPDDNTIEMYWESCNDQPPVEAVGNHSEDELQVFPNPADEKLCLVLPSHSRKSRIRIFDLNGRIMLEDRIDGSESRTIIDISSLAMGVYFLVVFDSGLIFRRKLIIL